MHPIIQYFNQHFKLNTNQIEYLTQNIPMLNIDKNTVLLEEGQISKAFYYVVKGCVRMYYIVDGIEKTTFFYETNDFVSSYESYTKQLPSTHFIQALEETEIAVFKAEVVSEILQKYPEFDFLARLIMERELSIYQEMIADFVTMNAEQRYLKLLQQKPHLLQRVPQHQIATYLGVSPETLSRIRNRITSKGLS